MRNRGNVHNCQTFLVTRGPVILVTILLKYRAVKGFLRDAWFEQILARDMWKQLKSRRDSWIDGPAWSVIREKPESIYVIRDLRGKKARDSWLGPPPPLYHPVSTVPWFCFMLQFYFPFVRCYVLRAMYTWYVSYAHVSYERLARAQIINNKLQ